MDAVATRQQRYAASRRRRRHAGVAQEDVMAMVKAGLAGAAVGALALATLVFVAPIAAQGPSGGPRAPGGPGQMDRGGDVTGPLGRSDPGRGMGRRDIDPSDPDITGPRGGIADCQERLTRTARARLERIARLVRPTEEQRPAYEELRMAFSKGTDVLRAACPAEQPLTPPARMAAAEKWLEARLQATKLVRPALESFWRLLSDEQKVRWSLGPHGDPRFRFDDGGDQQDRPGERRGDERRDDDRRGDWRDDRGRDDRWRDDRWRDERWRDRFGGDRAPRPEERWRNRWRERGEPGEERL
jgi:hypothetical protein